MLYNIWSNVWRPSNFIKHDQARSNKISKVETVRSPNDVWLCLLAKHFPFGWGLRGMNISRNFPRTLSHVTQTFRTKQINKNRFWLIWLPHAFSNYSCLFAQCDWRDSVQMAPLFQCPSFLLIKHSTVYKLRLQHIWYTVYFTTVPVAFEINGVDLGQGNGDQFDIAGSSKYPMANGWKNKGKSEGDGGEVEYAITGNSKNRIRASGVPTLWYPNIAFRHINSSLQSPGPLLLIHFPLCEQSKRLRALSS